MGSASSIAIDLDVRVFVSRIVESVTGAVLVDRLVRILSLATRGRRR